MNKAKLISCIIISLLLLSSCASSVTVELTQEPTATEMPAATPEPTASPTPAPLTVEEIELSLEALTGEELEYDADDYIALSTEMYMFTGSSGKYYVYSDTGEVSMYFSTDITEISDTLITEEEALTIAIDTTSVFCPEFFNYDYYLETISHGSDDYDFYFYQLSSKGFRTGNHINADIYPDGTVSAFAIFYDNEPDTVNGEYSVKEDDALDIAYGLIPTLLDEAFSEEGYLYETDADIMENHIVESYISCHKNRIMWYMEIQNIYAKVTPSEGTVWEYSLNFSFQIYADTGEVFTSGYSISDIENYTD